MWLEILYLTLIIEIITILGRLIFGSIKQYYKKNNLRIRIHHGYVGIGLLFVYLFANNNYILIIGLSLLFSDLIHHFVVLPIWVKKTEFP